MSEGRTVYEAAVFDSVDLARRLLDGMNFHIYTPPSPAPVLAGWTEGGGNLSVSVDLVESTRTVALPEDIEIRVGDAGIDSSFVEFPFQQRTPVNFEVFGITTGREFQFFFEETGEPTETLSDGDVVTIVFDRQGFRFDLAWRFTFSKPQGAEQILPQKGDVYRLEVSKPYSALDEVQFSTRASAFDAAAGRDELSDIYVVPDPYVASASWERPLFNASGRGERRIDFVNLPPKCTIRIFNMAGKLVQVLEHDSALQDGSESWDLVSKDGLTVAFGVYIFHVDAPGIGEQVGKFTLIK